MILTERQWAYLDREYENIKRQIACKPRIGIGNLHARAEAIRLLSEISNIGQEEKNELRKKSS